MVYYFMARDAATPRLASNPRRFPTPSPRLAASPLLQDINYIQVPMSAQPQGMRTVLVDALSKKAE